MSVYVLITDSNVTIGGVTKRAGSRKNSCTLIETWGCSYEEEMGKGAARAGDQLS